jgi:predicted  nucleic acid-binding Zn-ribbon protein
MDSERMKHYERREKLSDYEIQMRENEEEKVKKEQEIQNLQDRIKVLEEKLDELTLDSSEN